MSSHVVCLRVSGPLLFLYFQGLCSPVFLGASAAALRLLSATYVLILEPPVICSAQPWCFKAYTCAVHYFPLFIGIYLIIAMLRGLNLVLFRLQPSLPLQGHTYSGNCGLIFQMAKPYAPWPALAGYCYVPADWTVYFECFGLASSDTGSLIIICK